MEDKQAQSVQPQADAAALPPTEQVHLATYAVSAESMSVRGHSLLDNQPTARIMRSTVMKPESATAIPMIQSTLERLVTQPGA